MLEAIAFCERISGNKMNYSYTEDNRIGDHIWWISDVSKFKAHYPSWNWEYNIEDILVEIHEAFVSRAVN